MSEELVNDFEFQLSQGFEFSHGAQTEVATHLKVFAPNGKVIQHTAILENEINSAVFKVAEKVSQNPNNNENIPQLTKEKTDDDSSDYESIIMVISANANLLTCFQALKAILTTKTPGKRSSMCYVNGVEALNATMFEEMNYTDLKKLLVAYVQNFINASLKI